MDITTFLVSVVIAFGLIGSDAYVNRDRLFLEANVSSDLVSEGYSSYVVVDRMVDQMRRFQQTGSLVSKPKFHASSSKSFGVAVAAAVNAEQAMVAMQNLIGFVPPNFLATVVATGEDVKILISGFSEDSGFLRTSADGKANDMEAVFDLAALNVVLQVDPYTAILHNIAGNPGADSRDATRGWIRDAISKLPETPLNTPRAYLENLRGMVALMDNDEEAETYFRQAIRSKPDFAISRLNLAFTLLHLGKYQEAIAAAEPVTAKWLGAMTDRPLLLASAWNVIGLARWRLGYERDGVRAFRKALKADPKSVAANIYWGRLLTATGETEAAARKFTAAQRNAASFKNYPEVAMLYFWVPDKPGTLLTPRAPFTGEPGAKPKG